MWTLFQENHNLICHQRHALNDNLMSDYIVIKTVWLFY